MITFSVPGDPVGKGRARSFRKGDFIGHYTPHKTASYENLVKLIANQQMAGKELIECPVNVKLDICFGVPGSWSKKKTNDALYNVIAPAKKPDIDNIIKILFDSINGIVWKDDKQVVSVNAAKRYAMKPHIDVVVTNAKVELVPE